MIGGDDDRGGSGPIGGVVMAIGAAALFMIGLGFLAFLTRHAPGPARTPIAPVVTEAFDAGTVATPEATLADEVFLEALSAATLGVGGCFDETLRRDPAAGASALFQVRVVIVDDLAHVDALELVGAPSPFFRPCARRLASELPTPPNGERGAVGTRQALARRSGGAVTWELR